MAFRWRFQTGPGCVSCLSQLTTHAVPVPHDSPPLRPPSRPASGRAVKALFEPVIAKEPGWGVYHYNGLKVLKKGGA